MDKLRNQLKVAFASTFTFYLKVHGCHWNVEGPEFYQLHKMFEKIYKDVYNAVDPMAEHIRALGAYAPAGIKRISALSVIDDDNSILSSSQMLSELRADNLKVIESLKDAFKAAQSENQQGVMNFLADRVDQHQKWGWFIAASEKKIMKDDTQ